MFRLVRLLLASALIIISATPSWASAQSTDNPWDEPLNLSHSGVAVNPAIVIDSDAVVHAIWKDDLLDFVYTQLDDDQWTAPRQTDLKLLFRLPGAGGSASQSQLSIYTGPNPLFVAGPGPYIFAFWLTPEGRLFTSRVKNSEFEHVAGWDAAGLIASDAASFAVTVDARGDWHLAYFRTLEDPTNPAGIYYTRSRNGGQSWARPMLLYTSPYIRRLIQGEANLSLATSVTGDALHVYIAWDNRPRKEVLLAQSADGGESWTQPLLVAGPTPESGSTGPFNIHVGANQNSAILIWQSGTPGGACSQIYQFSSDAGATWNEPRPMLTELSECAHTNQIVAGSANNPRVPPRLYLLTETQSQVFLTAWNGLRWSEPQVQATLSGFEDPEIYTEVIYGCHQAASLGERLYMIGCDQGSGGDVWVTSRDLGSVTSWFSSPVWSQPAPITDIHLEPGAVELVATKDGLIHGFFSQLQDPTIYHISWDGEVWSHITPVLELPEGEAGWPAIAAGPGDEIFVITPNNRGALYFSRATSGSAGIASDWLALTPLGVSHDGGIASADVAWEASGTISVVYSIPVNEERGIYLVQSKDHGRSWSDPLQVFDGAAAAFDLVGAPSLHTSENGSLHILWKQQSIRGDGISEPVSLYLIRSEDGGQTFSEAELIVDEPVAWRELVTDNQGNLHLLWQSQGAVTTVWDQVSLDGGRSWQFPQGLPVEDRLAAVTRDLLGRLHLVGVGPGALDHWLWEDSRWQLEAPLDWAVSSQEENRVDTVTAAINNEGKMLVLLARPADEGGVMARALLFSTRLLEVSPNQSEIQEIPTQTPLPPTVTPATPFEENLLPSPTAVDSAPGDLQVPRATNEADDTTSPFTAALLPVALLLLSVLGIVVWRAVRTRDR